MANHRASEKPTHVFLVAMDDPYPSKPGTQNLSYWTALNLFSRENLHSFGWASWDNRDLNPQATVFTPNGAVDLTHLVVNASREFMKAKSQAPHKELTKLRKQFGQGLEEEIRCEVDAIQGYQFP